MLNKYSNVKKKRKNEITIPLGTDTRTVTIK